MDRSRKGAQRTGAWRERVILGKSGECESTEFEWGLKKGQVGVIWALGVHIPTQCVAFLPGISQTQRHVHMLHSTVFLWSDYLVRTCIRNPILSRNMYLFGFFSHMSMVDVSVQQLEDIRPLCIRKKGTAFFSITERGKSLYVSSILSSHEASDILKGVLLLRLNFFF